MAVVNLIVEDPRADLVVVGHALEVLMQDRRGVRDCSTQVLCEICSRRAGHEVRSVDQVARWLLGVFDGAALARLLVGASLDQVDDQLEATVLLLVARRVPRLGDSKVTCSFNDAQVMPLDRSLIEEWKRNRANSSHEWLYHPRRTEIRAFVVRKFLADLINTSPQIREDAEVGRLACDLNVVFAANGRNKTLDCVLGHPAELLGVALDPKNPLRKSRLDKPVITVEVKACMTSHRQANSRLIDELHSSVEVVKARSKRVIPVAIVIVNVSPTFTNPLNLPGPNKHVPAEVARVFERVIQRLRLDGGTGTDVAYGGLGLVVVDTDNERRIREASREGRVPLTHTYERTVGRVVSLYETLVMRR